MNAGLCLLYGWFLIECIMQGYMPPKPYGFCKMAVTKVIQLMNFDLTLGAIRSY